MHEAINDFLDWFALAHRGYQFWSGIGFSWTTAVIYARRHNCHERWCPFLVFKPHPDDPDHMICRWHHRHVRQEDK